MGVTVVLRGKERKPKEVPRRGKTAPQTEFLAIEHGLRLARDLGAPRVLVRSDSQFAMDVLNWRKFASKPHITKVLDRISGLEEQFQECAYEWIPREDNFTSDQASKHARKVAEEREAARIERKAEAVTEALARAGAVQVKQMNGRCYARDPPEPWFPVDVENMTCGCYAYTKRWCNVPLAGRKKSMTPCKHMAKVAQAQGYSFV